MMNEIIKFVKSDKRIVVTVIIILVLILLGTILAFTVGSSVAFNLESEMKEMGKDFYENFYYSELNKSEEDKKEFLSKFQSLGIKINLSNLARSNKKDNEEKIKNFVNPKTKEPCDLENSMVIIYPKSPFGQTDYSMEVKLVCGLEDN